MRTISTTAQIAREVGSQASWVNVQVFDGASWIDLSDHVGVDWLIGVEYGESQDGRSLDASVTVRTRHELALLSPLATSSIANDPNIVLATNNQITIDVGVAAADSVPAAADRLRVFTGRITNVQVGAQTTVLRCIDYGWDLSRAFIQIEQNFGDNATSVEAVMQQVLTAFAPGVTLYTPNGTAGTPLNAGDLAGWLISTYRQKREPVLDALRTLAGSIAYDLRYRWHSNTSDMQLQIFAPDRTATVAAHTFDSNDYFDLTTCEINIHNIRNHIVVVYANAAGNRTSVNAQDASSISTYGEMWCEISEGDTSPIDSSVEAQKMADGILADLKDPTATITMTLPFFPWAELGDLYAIAANNVHFDSALDLACVGIRHILSGKQQMSTLTLQGAPSAGIQRWLEIQQAWVRRTIDTGNVASAGFAPGGLCPNGDLSQFGGF